MDLDERTVETVANMGEDGRTSGPGNYCCFLSIYTLVYPISIILYRATRIEQYPDDIPMGLIPRHQHHHHNIKGTSTSFPQWRGKLVDVTLWLFKSSLWKPWPIETDDFPSIKPSIYFMDFQL